MKKTINKQLILYCGALALMGVAFFLISRYGFLWSDDYAMGYGKVFTLQQVLSSTKWFYLNWGGGFLGAAFQYLFCGLFGNDKIWFDIVNTMVFVVLILVCGKIIEGDKKEYWFRTFCFALLFWFFCPVPKETIFWMVGSMGDMWTVTMTFLFICVFLRCYNDNSSFGIKVLLFLFAIVTADSIIPCVSICGAFVVYYAMHLKKFRGNAVPLVVGFVIGSLILLLAPGNFIRAAAPDSYPISVKLQVLFQHPLEEIVKYRVFWLLVLAVVIGLIKDKKGVMAWMADNAILCYSLAWSVIAFTFVFRPARRALFFTETLSIVLLLKFIFETSILSQLLASRKNWLERVSRWTAEKGRWMLPALLFACFVVDAGWAISETRRQRQNNEMILDELKAAGGINGADCCISKHRMAYAPDYPDWSWEGIAYQLGLDSVHIYPYYCQDKYFRNSPYGENVYVDEVGRLNYEQTGHLNKYGIIFVRVPDDLVSNEGCPLLVIMDYEKPDKWLKDKMERLLGREKSKARTVVVDRSVANESFLGYDYFFIWMKKENIRGLKNVDVEFK